MLRSPPLLLVPVLCSTQQSHALSLSRFQIYFFYLSHNTLWHMENLFCLLVVNIFFFPQRVLWTTTNNCTYIWRPPPPPSQIGTLHVVIRTSFFFKKNKRKKPRRVPHTWDDDKLDFSRLNPSLHLHQNNLTRHCEDPPTMIG